MTNSTSGTARFPRRRRPRQGRRRSRGARRRSSASLVTRVDAYDRVSGSAVYPSDVILPDMLHAAILSCPHAHAIVKSVDTSAAEKMPGVQAVLKDGVRRHEHPVVRGPRRLHQPAVRPALPLRRRRGGRRGRRHDLPGVGRRAGDQGRVRRAAAGHLGRGRAEAGRAGRAGRRQRHSAGAALHPRRRGGGLQGGRRRGRAHVHDAVRTAQRHGTARVRGEVGRPAPHRLGVDAGRLRACRPAWRRR